MSDNKQLTPEEIGVIKRIVFELNGIVNLSQSDNEAFDEAERVFNICKDYFQEHSKQLDERCCELQEENVNFQSTTSKLNRELGGQDTKIKMLEKQLKEAKEVIKKQSKSIENLETLLQDDLSPPVSYRTLYHKNKALHNKNIELEKQLKELEEKTESLLKWQIEECRNHFDRLARDEGAVKLIMMNGLKVLLL